MLPSQFTTRHLSVKKYKYSILFIMFFMVLPSWSQGKVDEAQLKKADALFDQGAYLQALDSYRQLLSLSPENHDLNFKYGACLIYTDEDTAEPIKYLKYGASAKIVPAYYFLGKAYQLNYQFADAEKYFKMFASKADKKQKTKYSDVDLLIKTAQSGQALMKDIKDIVVLDKTEASVNEFFRSYKTDDIGGKIIKTPEELLSKKDKSSGEPSLIYFMGGGRDIYFSSYGSDNQRDIYKVRRLDNGKYTKPVKLGGGVNTPYDENYPYMHPDGTTLYFSSKGHNSMGGYDIFKSELNPNTGAFGPAINLDFAVSSPDDDIFYVSDLNNRTAFFASGRSSEQGRLHVYHVEVEASIASLTILKGKYIATDDSKNITIRIDDATTNKEIGVFIPDEKTGKYIINLPRNGKYKFYVEEDGVNTVHSGMFETPKSKGSVVYAQEMTFTKINGGNQLVLNNLFDKPLEEDVASLVAEALKMKAQLDVNKGDFVVEEVADDAEMDMDKVLRTAGFDPADGIGSVLEESKSIADEFASQSVEDNTDAQTLFAYANSMKQQADASLAEASANLNQAENETDNSRKEELLVKAAWNKNKANNEYQESVNALSVLKIIERNSNKKYERYTQIVESTKDVEKKSQGEDASALLERLKSHKELIDQGEMPGVLEIIQEETLEKRRLSGRALAFAQEMDDEKRQVKDKIKVRERQLENTTKKKEREILEQELLGLKEEQTDYETQAKDAYKKYEKRLKDQTNSENQSKLLAEYKLKSEDDAWADVEPVAYTPEDVISINNSLRKAKREVEKINIDEVEITQILADRNDLSHRFDFGEIHHENAETSHTIADVVPDDLEFIDEDSAKVEVDEVMVIKNDVETEDDYEMFLLTSKESEDPIADYDLKIIKYNADKENASAEDILILNKRIEKLEQLKANHKENLALQAQQEVLDNTDPKSIEMSDKNLSEVNEGEMVSWVSGSFATRKQEIIDSDATNEEKQVAYQTLNAELRKDIEKRKAELMNIYTVNNIAGTTKADINLATLDALAESHGELDTLNLEEAVAVNQLDTTFTAANENRRDTNVVENTEAVETGVDSQQNSRADQNTTEVIDENDVLRDAQRVEPTLLTSREQMIEASVKANVLNVTQENVLRLQLVDGQDITPLEKIENRLKFNQQYLEELKATEKRNMEIMRLNLDKEASLIEENDALQSLILTTESHLEEDQIAYAQSKGIAYSATDLLKTKYRPSYFKEIATLRSNQVDDTEYQKKILLLDNRIAFELEDKLNLLQIELRDPNISNYQRQQWIKEQGQMKKAYEAIREVNAIVINQLGLNVTEEEVYDRQKKQSYVTDNSSRPDDYTMLLLSEGYKETRLQSSEAQSLQAEANDAIRLLANQNLDAIAYKKAEDQIGEMMLNANNIELASLSHKLSSVDFTTIGDDVQRYDINEKLQQATLWESKLDSLRVLLPEAKGDEKNRLLKEAVAAQLNTIESKRQAQAIVNYVEDGGTGAPLVFEQFVVPNQSLTSLQDNPDYDLSDLIFDGDYQTPTTAENTSLAEVPNTNDSDMNRSANGDENTIANDTEEENTPSDSASSNTISLIESQNLTDDDLNQARIRLNNERIKETLPLNANGVPLSIPKSNEIEAQADTDMLMSEVELIKKQALIEELKQMITDNTDIQKTYADNIYLRQQGLSVVMQSIDTDGLTDVLAKEHNRIISELKQLLRYNKNAEDNVLKLDAQITREEEAIVSLRQTIADELTQADMVVDENLPVPAIPDVLTRNVFVRSTQPGKSAYNNENPIPIDPEMPDGIIYQVQVGAYRQPIPQDLFKGFAPIMGQRIHSGITRYKVGLFTALNIANTAKDEIRAMGYSDAFVIVFNNGERISLTEARNIAGGDGTGSLIVLDENGEETGVGTSDTSNGMQAETGTTTETEEGIESMGETGSESGLTTNTTDGTGIEELPDYTFIQDDTKDDYYNDTDAAVAKQVEMIKGLFYTVQIGAYSKPVASDKLNNIRPLNTELTSTGIIRYTSGIYNNINAVSTYKTEVVDAGIPDAFVSAYYNGYRITLSKAKALVEQYGNDVWVDGALVSSGSVEPRMDTPTPVDTQDTPVDTVVATPVDNTPTTPRSKDDVLDAANSLIESGLPTQMIWDLLEEEGLLESIEEEDNTFKVILGPFVEAIPTREVEIILNFKDNIQFEEKGENEYVYSSITPIPYDEARNLKELLEKEGIDSAKIVSFKGGKEMSLQEFLDGLSD